MAASAVMLLATQYAYDQPTDAPSPSPSPSSSSSAEAAAVAAEVKGLVAAVGYVAEGDECAGKSHEQRARVPTLPLILTKCLTL